MRLAMQEDVEAISHLLRENSLPLDGFEDHIADFIVALIDGKVSGCAGIEHHEDSGLLRSVAVASDVRRTGMGARLVDRCIDDARHRGIRSLVLLTTTAEEYFLRFGFSRISRDQVPFALLASAEFRGACPDSAVVMMLRMGA